MDPFRFCRLSDPSQPHELWELGSYDEQPLPICFSCKLGITSEYSRHHFYCKSCDLYFHTLRQMLPPDIKNVFHPSHSLTLILNPRIDISLVHKCWDGDLVSATKSLSVVLSALYVVGEDEDEDEDEEDDEDEDENDDDDDDDDDDVVSLPDGTPKCKCCRRQLLEAYYHCSICNFNLNWNCAMEQPDLIISHVKSHSHPLSLFPIRVSSPCDACGLSLKATKELVYACLPCSHMIHEGCIHLPRVIKITRHRHRLSFTFSLFRGDLLCGVCREKVDTNYGRFSCQKGCEYSVHSKCATRKAVWDGKDLEDVPEEPEENVEPFVKVDDETILHFSHEHNLILHQKKTICERNKYCEACNIPIKIYQRFYWCTECDFVLDEACASLPRKQDLPLHKHPLTLYPYPIGVLSKNTKPLKPIEGIFKCNGCQLQSCGFEYKCDEDDCEFQLDVRCAALPDPFTHGCHPQDPLYFNLTKGKCMGCGSDDCSAYFVECIKCRSFLGLKCATFPSVAHYKHDKHPLTLCYGEEDTTNGQYWCDICEKKLDSKNWFYTCDMCRITLHVGCLLGKGIYMKHKHIFNLSGSYVGIALNDGNSRPVCSKCSRRCEDTFVYELMDDIDITCCSLTCMQVYVVLRSVGRR